MKSEIRRSQRDYSLAFKLSVVEQVEKGELTYKEAQRRYGIQGRSTVLVWLRKHGRPYALHKPHLLNGEVTVYRDIFRTWPSRRSKQPASKSQAD